MHTLHARPLCFIPYLKKTIYLIPFIFLNASIGYGSSGVTIIPDYTSLNRLTIYPIPQHNQKVSGLITLLDKEFPTTEGLYQYLTSVQSLEDVSALIAVAKEFLAVPEASRRDHQKSIRFNHTYIEERAFHILNFAYLMRHTHTHWLRYYYAFSIIAFPESAKEKLEKIDPIRFAVDIYKHWSEERKSELYAHEIHFGGKGDIPYITLLSDPTMGGVAASFAMLGDIALAEPGSMIGFAGARVIQQIVRENLPADFQKAEYLKEHGMIDRVVERKHIKAELGTIMKLLMVKRLPHAF